MPYPSESVPVSKVRGSGRHIGIGGVHIAHALRHRVLRGQRAQIAIRHRRRIDRVHRFGHRGVWRHGARIQGLLRLLLLLLHHHPGIAHRGWLLMHQNALNRRSVAAVQHRGARGGRGTVDRVGIVHIQLLRTGSGRGSQSHTASGRHQLRHSDPAVIRMRRSQRRHVADLVLMLLTVLNRRSLNQSDDMRQSPQTLKTVSGYKLKSHFVEITGHFQVEMCRVSDWLNIIQKAQLHSKNSKIRNQKYRCF